MLTNEYMQDKYTGYFIWSLIFLTLEYKWGSIPVGSTFDWSCMYVLGQFWLCCICA